MTLVGTVRTECFFPRHRVLFPNRNVSSPRRLNISTGTSALRRVLQVRFPTRTEVEPRPRAPLAAAMPSLNLARPLAPIATSVTDPTRRRPPAHRLRRVTRGRDISESRSVLRATRRVRSFVADKKCLNASRPRPISPRVAVVPAQKAQKTARLSTLLPRLLASRASANTLVQEGSA